MNQLEVLDPSTQTQLATPLTIEQRTRTVTVRGQQVSLTKAEYDALLMLAERRGQVVSRDELFLELRGMEYDGLDRSMDLRIARIRRKLRTQAAAPSLIKSVRGEGYMLVNLSA